MGANQALKEITTAKKSYQQLPALQALSRALLLGSIVTLLLHIRQEPQQSEEKLKRHEVMVFCFFFLKGEFSLL